MTTPGDVVQLRSEEVAEGSPPLSRDTSAPPEHITGARSTVILFVGMALIVLLALAVALIL